MADTVQRIKEKLSIIDVVTPYVKLSKAGKYMRGLSPFTKEKTPSFYVWPERGSYYCFSTAQGGDHFTFIEKMEGLDFKGALKMLAEKAGVEIVYEKGGENRDRSERLREAMSQAVAFFSAQLAEGTAAYEYAKKRGLSPETIAAWELGFSPDAWRALLEHLSGLGFTQAELLAAGLIKEADGRPGTFYDRFRNRLMFPIRDTAGRTVAFTGRTMKDDEQAKYLNSPETDLFKKSEVLFGMDRAKDAIRTRGFLILVEGQFDLILLHQIGFTNTVALSGTALSPQHLSLIKRYADNLMLCLDADRAGLAASAKNAHAALAAGMRVKAVRLPEGKDPADLALEDPKDFVRRISEAQPIIRFFLSVLIKSEPDQNKAFAAAESIVLPLISSIPSSIERERFIEDTSRMLGMPPDAIRVSLPHSLTQSSGYSNRLPNYNHNSARSPVGPEFPGQPGRTGRVNSDELSNEGVPSMPQKYAVRIRAIRANYPGTDLAQKLKNEYARIIGAEDSEEPLDERALFEAGLAYGESPSESDADELVRAFEHAVLSEKLKKTTEELRRAEATEDMSVISTLIATCREISIQLAKLS